MSFKIYVGSLPYRTNDDDLRQLFATFGEVISAKVIIDRDSGQSKGFGFVEMDSADDGKKAIEALDKSEFEGRTLTVNEARPQEARPPRRDGGGGGSFRSSGPRDNGGSFRNTPRIS